MNNFPRFETEYGGYGNEEVSDHHPGDNHPGHPAAGKAAGDFSACLKSYKKSFLKIVRRKTDDE